MRIRGVLLGTKEEQAAGGDKYPIDPPLVKLDRNVPVSVEFKVDEVVGSTTRLWHEDGRIMFEAELHDQSFIANAAPKYPSAAIGITLERYDANKNLIRGGTVFEVGLTAQNENRNQPPWEEVE
jgi:hypothetical protein